jgi:hypothetical protein
MLKSGSYTVGLLLVTFLLLVGCGEYEQILKSRDYPVKFEKAIAYYND